MEKRVCSKDLSLASVLAPLGLLCTAKSYKYVYLDKGLVVYIGAYCPEIIY